MHNNQMKSEQIQRNVGKIGVPVLNLYPVDVRPNLIFIFWSEFGMIAQIFSNKLRMFSLKKPMLDRFVKMIRNGNNTFYK